MTTTVWNDAVKVAVVRSAGNGDRVALVDYAKPDAVMTTLIENGIPVGGGDYDDAGCLDKAMSDVQQWCIKGE